MMFDICRSLFYLKSCPVLSGLKVQQGYNQQQQQQYLPNQQQMIQQYQQQQGNVYPNQQQYLQQQQALQRQKEQQMLYDQRQQQQPQQQVQVNPPRGQHAFNVSLDKCHLHSLFRLRKENVVLSMIYFKE